MPGSKCLIVNADDFGLSPGVNRGVIEAYERGIVTSASLMVRWPAAAEAAAYACTHPELSLGLHVDLAEWAFRGGAWTCLYEVVPVQDERAVAAEVERQLTTFRALTGRNPTHLDSHQHVHRDEPVRSVVAVGAGALGIPVRHGSAVVRYCGEFYGQYGRAVPYPEGISVANLVRILANLPCGYTELACHPGDGSALDSMYVRERAAELRALCDPQVRAAVNAEGIQLCSFHDLAGDQQPG